MHKENVINTYNGILYSLKIERNPDIYVNMDEPIAHYAKSNNSLYESSYMRYLK